jgi:type III restriction enzyme
VVPSIAIREGVLKNIEITADKVRCGQKHFEALGAPFDVAVTADEV